MVEVRCKGQAELTTDFEATTLLPRQAVKSAARPDPPPEAYSTSSFVMPSTPTMRRSATASTGSARVRIEADRARQPATVAAPVDRRSAPARPRREHGPALVARPRPRPRSESAPGWFGWTGKTSATSSETYCGTSRSMVIGSRWLRLMSRWCRASGPPRHRRADLGSGRSTGGGSGIRTRDTVSRIHTFQACAFSHSATPPAGAGRRADAVASASPTVPGRARRDLSSERGRAQPIGAAFTAIRRCALREPNRAG